MKQYNERHPVFVRSRYFSPLHYTIQNLKLFLTSVKPPRFPCVFCFLKNRLSINKNAIEQIKLIIPITNRMNSSGASLYFIISHGAISHADTKEWEKKVKKFVFLASEYSPKLIRFNVYFVRRWWEEKMARDKWVRYTRAAPGIPPAPKYPVYLKIKMILKAKRAQ